MINGINITVASIMERLNTNGYWTYRVPKKIGRHVMMYFGGR